MPACHGFKLQVTQMANDGFHYNSLVFSSLHTDDWARRLADDGVRIGAQAPEQTTRFATADDDQMRLETLGGFRNDVCRVAGFGDNGGCMHAHSHLREFFPHTY